MDDKATAAKIVADLQVACECNEDGETTACFLRGWRRGTTEAATQDKANMESAIVAALEAARREGAKQVVDEAEKVSQILRGAVPENADVEAAARFEVDRFVFACAGSIVGAEVTDRQRHTLFHQFKGVIESCERKIEAARREGYQAVINDIQANEKELTMLKTAHNNDCIIDCTGDVPCVRRVLATRQDNFIVDGVEHYGATQFIVAARAAMEGGHREG